MNIFKLTLISSLLFPIITYAEPDTQQTESIGFMEFLSAIYSFVMDSETEKQSKLAFYALEENPRDQTVRQQAEQTLATAFFKDPENPWVLIGMSRLFLEKGYRGGDRSLSRSYTAETIEAATELAEEAVKHGDDISMAYVQLAKTQMLKNELKTAWLTLNGAYKADPDDFYPWYYRAVISMRMQDTNKALMLLDDAEKRAKLDYQKRWVNDRRKNVAKFIRN